MDAQFLLSPVQGLLNLSDVDFSLDYSILNTVSL